MQHHLLRQNHLITESHLKIHAAPPGGSLPTMIVSFAVLAAVAAFYLRQGTVSKHRVPISPSSKQQAFIILGVVTLLGVSGVMALIGQSLTTSTWIYYAVCNLVLAGYIYCYQKDFKHCLWVALVLMFIFESWTVVVSQGVTSNAPHTFLLINFIGICQAFGLVWTMFIKTQALINCGTSKKWTSISFFVSVIVLFVVRMATRQFAIQYLYGYIATVVGLTTLMFFRQQDHHLLQK